MTTTPDASPGSSSQRGAGSSGSSGSAGSGSAGSGSAGSGSAGSGSAGSVASGSVAAYERPWVALLLAAVGVVAAALLILGYPSLRMAWLSAPGWVQSVLDLVVLSLPLVLAVWAAVALGSTRGMAAALGIRSWRWMDLVLGIGVALIVRAVVEVIAPTAGSLGGGFETDAAAQTLNTVVVVIGLTLVTPIVEELFFRGVIVRALSDALGAAGRVSSGIVAVAVSTAAFTWLHAVSWENGPPLALLVGTIGVGLGTGILVLITGRLGGAIVTHIVFNTLGVVLLLL